MICALQACNRLQRKGFARACASAAFQGLFPQTPEQAFARAGAFAVMPPNVPSGRVRKAFVRARRLARGAISAFRLTAAEIFPNVSGRGIAAYFSSRENAAPLALPGGRRGAFSAFASRVRFGGWNSPLKYLRFRCKIFIFFLIF